MQFNKIAFNIDELEGVALDHEVAKFTGCLRMINGTQEYQLGEYRPSIDWKCGGSLIEQQRISITPYPRDGYWGAQIFCKDGYYITEEVNGPIVCATGNTPLVAACRVFVKACQAQKRTKTDKK